MSDRRMPTVLLAVGHGCVDIFQGIVPVMVPFLVAERHYDYVAVSGFVLAATVLSSVVQPVFGLLTDRWVMRWLVPAAMVCTGLGVALVGAAGSYPLALAAIALSGIGVAAYHPEGARLARVVTGGDHVRMSWFSLGGNVGFAFAPVIATPVLVLGGLAAAPVLLAPALLGVLVTVPLLRRRAGGAAPAGGATRAGTAGSAATAGAAVGGRGGARRGADDWPAFGVLTGVIVLRSIAFVGLSTFLALFVQQRVAQDATAGGIALFVLYAGGAVGTWLGGRMAATWGRLPTMRVSYAASAVALAGVAFVPGPALLAFVGLASLALYAPFSLHITLGQDYLPSRIGTASGVTLGLAVSVGGAFAPALGAIAQASSIQVMLGCLIVLPVLCAALALRLREPSAPARL
ncbi:MFS transporter [Pseudonocardia acaciae]|uniref:MFS transporter n=1 Tax=Pseudonocardia acaciae TaxID=551276 RepID=UPI00048E1701|nr:MFS transporter [Pseudonocardia acaciae]